MVIDRFSAFSRLPTELRRLIWNYALPGRIGATLHFFKSKNTWGSRDVTVGEEHYEADREGFQKLLEFQLGLLDNEVQFDMPLLSVNSEARALALAWIREQGIITTPSKPTKFKNSQPGRRKRADLPVLSGRRPFCASRDALYVPYTHWISFLASSVDPNFPSGTFFGVSSDLEILAIPEDSMDDNTNNPQEIFEDHPNLRSLLVVMGTKPNYSPPYSDDNDNARLRDAVSNGHPADSMAHERWEYESLVKGSFIWQPDQERLLFDGTVSADEIPDRVHRMIEKATTELKLSLREACISNFEIRPVTAIRKAYPRCRG